MSLSTVGEIRAYAAGARAKEVVIREQLEGTMANQELPFGVRREAFLTHMTWNVDLRQESPHAFSVVTGRYLKNIEHFSGDERVKVDDFISNQKDLVKFLNERLAANLDDVDLKGFKRLMKFPGLEFGADSIKVIAKKGPSPLLIWMLTRHEVDPTRAALEVLILRSPNFTFVLLEHPKMDVTRVVERLASPEVDDELFKQVVSYMPDLNANLGDGVLKTTILGWAAFANDREKVRWLLEQPEVDPNAPYGDGEPPVKIAFRRDSPEVLEEILKHPKTDLAVVDYSGLTVFDELRRKPKPDPKMKFLLEQALNRRP